MDTSLVQSADKATKPSRQAVDEGEAVATAAVTGQEATAISGATVEPSATAAASDQGPVSVNDEQRHVDQSAQPQQRRFNRGRRERGSRKHQRKYRQAMYDSGLPVSTFGQGQRHHPYHRNHHHQSHHRHHHSHHGYNLIERESGNDVVNSQRCPPQRSGEQLSLQEQQLSQYYHNYNQSHPPPLSSSIHKAVATAAATVTNKDLNDAVVTIDHISTGGHDHQPRASTSGYHRHGGNYHHHHGSYQLGGTAGNSKLYHKRRMRRRVDRKRPADAPPAPENSTQFIIDDLEQRIGPIDLDTDSGPESEEYEEKDFEAAFNGARFEELMCLERSELVERYQTLETSVDDLQRQLNSSVNSDVSLETQLMALREENNKLKRNNERLRSELRAKSDESSSSNVEDNGCLFQESSEPLTERSLSGVHMVTVGTSPRRPPSQATSPRGQVIASPHHANRSPMDDSRSPIHVVHSPQLLCIG